MNLWKIYESGIPQHLIDISNAPSLQRLKDIGMSCGCEYTNFNRFKNCPKYTRYDHSIGVALIIWHFTKDIQQSLAGLLHDIATPTFAHVIDFLNKDYLKQEYTESNTREIILSDEKIINILKNYNLTVNDVENYHVFPIADNDSPKLSADRLEYTLGNLIHYGIRKEETVAEYYNDIIVANNENGISETVFNHEELAVAFARDALLCSRVYTSDEDRYAMQKLADLLYNALSDNIITEKDFYTTETNVIEKMKSNKEYKRRWCDYCLCNRVIASKMPQSSNTWISVNAKKRHIDPFVVGKGRVSLLSNIYKNELELYLNENFDYWICGLNDENNS